MCQPLRHSSGQFELPVPGATGCEESCVLRFEARMEWVIDLVTGLLDRRPNRCRNVAGNRTHRSHRRHGILEYAAVRPAPPRSEEHTSELQSLMRISYAVFCLKKKNRQKHSSQTQQQPT